jgi:hypothetical protein
MRSTIKTLEQTTYDTVRSSSFTKIHGQPTQSNYEKLKKEALDIASELDDITHMTGHKAPPGTNTDS